MKKFIFSGLNKKKTQQMKNVILFFGICAVLVLTSCSGNTGEEATATTDSLVTDSIAADSMAVDSCATMPVDSAATDSVK